MYGARIRVHGDDADSFGFRNCSKAVWKVYGAAIVKAVTKFNDSKELAELSKYPGEAMVGINENEMLGYI